MGPKSRLLVALCSTGIVAYVFAGFLLGRVLGDTGYTQLAVFNEVVRLVIETYVEPVNLDRTMAGASLGLADALDGDSAYLDAEDFKAYPPKDSDAEIGVAVSRRFSFLMVVATRPGSPAEKAGIKTGDLIKTIDGRHTHPLGVPVGERLLRGDPGSIVKLTILRPGADPLDLSVVRERLTPAPPHGKILEAGAGYIRLAEFSNRTAEELRVEIESLKRSGARSLIVDLRGAAFGPVSEAVKVAELLIKGGTVTKLVGRRVTEQVFTADPSRCVWEAPLAVLIDSGTAGPGEIVAAAVLDSGRGSLVGVRTFGRAPVQKTITLPDGGLVLTVAKYLTPKGNPIHGKGLEPSAAVDDVIEEASDDAKPARDYYIEKALEILKAPASKAA